MLFDTICAISTPLQEGAIGIIRLSGSDAINIVDQIFDKDLLKVDTHTITYGYIHDDQQLIDEVLISVFKAPRSYTCEDVVEINCHGSVYLIRKILSLCLSHGARQALPGEFTQRAFLNGRIDLSQAEAVNDIILAQSANQAKQALNGIRGSVARLLDPLISEMLDLIANMEVNIDYPEYEDIKQVTNSMVRPAILKWQEQLATIITQAENGRFIKTGIKTVIVGEPNVGKSSLLNALLEEDKAIVTDIPGTTRDLVEGMIQLDNISLNLIDTAGLRDTKDVIEQIGIDKTKKALNEAELIIIVLDASKEMTAYEKELIAMTQDKKQLIVYNKADLVKRKEVLSISALNKDIKPLINAIQQMFETQMMVIDANILNNERQIALSKQAKQALDQAISALDQDMELDIVLIDIENAYDHLRSILYQVQDGDLLDTLFSNFCLGK